MSYCAVYLNRIYREKNLPEKAENPLITEKAVPYDANFTFVDFIPSVLVYSQPVEYHRFSHLVQTANSWLQKNSLHWKLINCETVKLSYRHNLTSMVSRWEQQLTPATSLWTAQPRGGEFEATLKALRLWLRRKDHNLGNNDTDFMMMNSEQRVRDCHPPLDTLNELKYFDFIPQRTGGNTGSNVFETIDDLLNRINARIQQDDAKPWNLLSLESLKVESNSEWTIDPELSLVEESSRCLTILRLYYEESSTISTLSNNQEMKIILGIKDFKPHLISGGSFFKKPQFEPFSGLVARASRWLHTQSHSIRFLNAQSIDIKIKSVSKLLHTRTCTSIEHGDYVQIFRVIFCRIVPNQQQNDSTMMDWGGIDSMTQQTLSSSPLPMIDEDYLNIDVEDDEELDFESPQQTEQLFSKVILATKLEHPLDSVQQRIYNWLNQEEQQNVLVLSAETVNIWAKDGDEHMLEKEIEECFQKNRLGTLNAFTFMAIRLYCCLMASSNPTSPGILERNELNQQQPASNQPYQQSTKTETKNIDTTLGPVKYKTLDSNQKFNSCSRHQNKRQSLMMTPSTATTLDLSSENQPLISPVGKIKHATKKPGRMLKRQTTFDVSCYLNHHHHHQASKQALQHQEHHHQNSPKTHHQKLKDSTEKVEKSQSPPAKPKQQQPLEEEEETKKLEENLAKNFEITTKPPLLQKLPRSRSTSCCCM